MKHCIRCGADYGDDNSFCPYCDEKYGNVILKQDVISGTFPQYEETEHHIIGDIEQRSDSFNANKLTVYKRNNLIIEQAALVDRETRRRDLEKERQELAQTDDKIRYNKFSRIFNRSAAAVAVGAALIIAFAVFIPNLRSENEAQTAVTAVIYEISETAAVKEAEEAAEKVSEAVVIEVPEEHSQTEAITVTTYLAAENTPLEASEGQYLFNNESVSAVMELSSFLPVVTAESRGAEYSLEVRFTVKNISDESFDIMPSGFLLYDTLGETVSAAEYTLKKLPDHYAIESGASVNFTLSYRAAAEFFSDAAGVKYRNDTTGIYNDTAAEGMSLAPKNEKLMSDEQTAELAAAVAENAAKAETSGAFTENDGAYIINDENISYAVSLNDLGGNKVLADIKVRRLNTAESCIFPSQFKLGGDIIGGSGTLLKRPLYFSFDTKYAEETVYSADKVSGFDGQLYDDPIRLYFGDENDLSFSAIYDITPSAYNNAEFNKFYVSSKKYAEVDY